MEHSKLLMLPSWEEGSVISELKVKIAMEVDRGKSSYISLREQPSAAMLVVVFSIAELILPKHIDRGLVLILQLLPLVL